MTPSNLNDNVHTESGDPIHLLPCSRANTLKLVFRNYPQICLQKDFTSLRIYNNPFNRSSQKIERPSRKLADTEVFQVFPHSDPLKHIFPKTDQCASGKTDFMGEPPGPLRVFCASNQECSWSSPWSMMELPLFAYTSSLGHSLPNRPKMCSTRAISCTRISRKG